MREILFRGKRAGNGEWIFGSIVHQTDYYGDRCDRWFILEGDATNDYDIDYPIEVQKETVGQYTGLTDKNGARIFEGDIVSGHLDDLFPEDESRYEITWIDYGWHLTNLDGTVDTAEQDWVNQNFEVIGNIHDNPELMEVEEHE